MNPERSVEIMTTRSDSIDDCLSGSIKDGNVKFTPWAIHHLKRSLDKSPNEPKQIVSHVTKIYEDLVPSAK